MSTFLGELGNGTPKELLENREMMDLLMPMLRADFSLGENLTPQGCVMLPCSACVLFSREDRIAVPHILAWQDLFVKQVNFYKFSGDHFFIHEQRTQVLSVLSSELNRILPT